MRRRAFGGALDGWLLILGGFGIGLVLWLAPAAGASSRDDEARARRDFDSLVHKVEGRYQVHGKSVPMMWLANICARSFTNGGVRGMKVVVFEDAAGIAKAGGPGEFGELVKTQLGGRWSPMVRGHEKNGEDTYVYVQSADDSKLTRMIVLDLDVTELDMVKMSLNPEQLAKWAKEHDAEPVKTISPGASAMD